jgi:hypothetical protein
LLPVQQHAGTKAPLGVLASSSDGYGCGCGSA